MRAASTASRSPFRGWPAFLGRAIAVATVLAIAAFSVQLVLWLGSEHAALFPGVPPELSEAEQREQNRFDWATWLAWAGALVVAFVAAWRRPAAFAVAAACTLSLLWAVATVAVGLRVVEEEETRLEALLERDSVRAEFDLELGTPELDVGVCAKWVYQRLEPVCFGPDGRPIERATKAQIRSLLGPPQSVRQCWRYEIQGELYALCFGAERLVSLGWLRHAVDLEVTPNS